MVECPWALTQDTTVHVHVSVAIIVCMHYEHTDNASQLTYVRTYIHTYIRRYSDFLICTIMWHLLQPAPIIKILLSV